MASHLIDPIISEVRAVRDAHAARFDYNLPAIFQDIREMQNESGREYVRLPARLVQIFKLDGDTWTKHTARAGFPILVEYARKRQEITYGEWNDEIVRRELGPNRLPLLYGFPAGSIGDACEDYTAKTGVPVPPINLMVINKKRRIPGSGADNYFRRYCAQFLDRDVDPNSLDLHEKRALIKTALQEIFDFPSWNNVLAACGLDPPTPLPEPERRRPQKSGWNTGPESDEHQRLKQMIADNPALVDLQCNEKGIQEHPLWSGDRLDVCFRKAAVGVEVKTSNAGFDEIHRGVFQCVKYKAVMQAQQVYDRQIPTAECLLALGGALPKELREVVALFDLRCYEKLAPTKSRRHRRR